MSDHRPDLAQLHADLHQGRVTAVLSAVEQLESDGPLADEVLRLKIAALEALGYDGEALEAALGLRDDRPWTILRLLVRVEDVVVTDELESALCDLLRTEEFFHPRVYEVLVNCLAEKLQAQGQAPAALHALAGNRFFCLALAKLDLWWPTLELDLTTLRRRILKECASPGDTTTSVITLVHGMAVQCHRNEYAWFVGDDEAALLDRVEQQSRGELAASVLGADRSLLLMYRSPTDLHKAGLIRRIPVDGEDSPLQHFVATTLDDEAREARLAEHFASQALPGDETSTRVAGMYEENPYPRWTSGLPILNPNGRPLEEFMQLVESPAWQHKPTLPVQSILVAGCGTGVQPLSLAVALPRARILAIDITCRSLAYARMMAERYQAANVEFQRCDILALSSSSQQFDMVDSVGVIHHMRDPAAGLRALLACLRPGGLLRLGVYSRSGRDAVVRFRARQAKSRADPAALREIRHDIVQAGDQGPYADLLQFRDFYNLSGCRDLLLHEQECQFTIPELRALLEAHGLTFLRFALQPGMTEALHDQASAGTSAFNLESWHQAELRTPFLFAGMYILFARFDGRD